MEAIELNGLASHRIEKRLTDARVVAGHDGNNAYIVIAVDYVEPSPIADPEVNIRVWIPDGFVVYPASDDANAGWGMPVIQHIDPSADPPITQYSSTNLAPGLDVSRWTPSGPLGQVLLTRAAGAGYAPAADYIAPMYFHQTFGLRPDTPVVYPVDGAEWFAFRLEMRDFTAQSFDATDADIAAMVAFKRGIFENVNEHRISVGRDALSLPLRWRYDSAQATAECAYSSQVTGHFGDAYPPTYKTRDDRFTKDGLTSAFVEYVNFDSRNEGGGENVIGKALPPITTIGPDPQGVNMYYMPVSAGWFTAQEAFDEWMGSPTHRAQIEDATYDVSAIGAAFTDVGIHENFAAQHFEPMDQWIHCANRSWQSAHAEIPVISWVGFHSINLAWETYPCLFNNAPGGVSGAHPGSTPLIKRFDFTSRVGSTDYVWMYHNYADGAQMQPAMSRYVMSRGRIIAIAPHDGLVWAAAVQRLVADTGFVYRLIVLTHHASDQSYDFSHGMTSNLRVWYVDMPEILGLALNPQTIIRGVYGEEAEGWPWDVVNSQWSWRGGGLVDVGTSDGTARDMLKYASQWVFNGTGTQAVCLRDYGKFEDYAALRSAIVGGSIVSYMSVSEGLPPTAITLDISGAFAVTLNWLGVSPATAVRAYAPPSTVYNVSERVVAAGYDADDALSFCFVAGVEQSNPALEFPWIDTTVVRFFRWSDNYSSLWVLGDDVTSFHRSFASAIPPQVSAATLTVIDVRDKVTMAVGQKQRWKFVETSPGTGYLDLNTPDYAACWASTSADVHNVTIWREHVEQHSKWYGNPEGWLPSWIDLCYRYGSSTLYAGTRLAVSRNHTVLASYAAKGDDWVLTYVVQPQNMHGWYTAIPVPTSPACTWGACTPGPQDTSSVYSSTAAFSRIGGYAMASFLDDTALMALSGVEGDNPVYLYARPI